jgi:hypothetical protein
MVKNGVFFRMSQCRLGLPSSLMQAQSFAAVSAHARDILVYHL